MVPPSLPLRFLGILFNSLRNVSLKSRHLFLTTSPAQKNNKYYLEFLFLVAKCCISLFFRMVRFLRSTFYYRFLSTGMSYRALSFSYRISHCAVRIIVYETCQAIWDAFCKKHMSLPTTDEWKNIANVFCKKWNFPNCISCINGKHVRIKCPKKKQGRCFLIIKDIFL